MKVCPGCFNDLELKSYIDSNYSEVGVCDFCTSSSEFKTIDIEELLDFFAEFLEIFKPDLDGIPLIDIIESDWNLFSENTNTSHLLTNILTQLDNFLLTYDLRVNYSPEIQDSIKFWEILKNDIKWNNRFLPNLDSIEEFGWDRYFANYFEYPIDIFFYRARLHKDGNQELYDEKDMGRPPQKDATSGRANPQGIPYLYLSESVETTLYEIRATFLDEVSVGIFKIKEEESIKIVDFTENPSAFLSVEDITEKAKSTILKRLISIDLSKPLRRYDSELEYIPTQFICEFIRNTGADGILFNSSLYEGGKNIVLFNEDKVECIKVEKHRISKIEIKSEPISE